MSKRTIVGQRVDRLVGLDKERETELAKHTTRLERIEKERTDVLSRLALDLGESTSKSALADLEKRLDLSERTIEGIDELAEEEG
jgi:hypothetical protein